MIFVFDVISGKFLGIEQNDSLTFVTDLRTAIERATGLQAGNQILLVSGGQVPLNENPLSSYDVGSEHNPYFLFARPALMINSADLGLSPVIQEDSVSSASATSGTHLLTTAEQLVHAQHLQHQGWQAAVGNLSDVSSNVRNASAVLRKKIEVLQQDESRLSSVECLSMEEDGAAVEDTIQRLQIASNLLKKIPLPHTLKRNSLENVSDLLQQLTGTSCSTVTEELQVTKDTLKDSFTLLETFEKWATESERTDMREIQGLTDRLGTLDTLLNNARIHCAGGGISTSPPRYVGASSPTNFVSRPLSDVVGRCAAAAAELRNNLNHRVVWLSHVQSRLARCAAHFVITSAKIRRRQKVIKNSLIYVSAAPFYVKLAIAQHSCSSALFKSCMPCPVHSNVSLSSDSLAGHTEFCHPLSAIFGSKHTTENSNTSTVRRRGLSLSESSDIQPAVFTAPDLDAIQLTVPSLFADQQAKYPTREMAEERPEKICSSTKEMTRLALKVNSSISADRAALERLRESVKTTLDSTTKMVEDYKKVFDQVLAKHDAPSEKAETENTSPKSEKQDVGIATDPCDQSSNVAVAASSPPRTNTGTAAPAQSASARPQARLNISLSGISTGDLVVVAWSEELEQPVILTISPVPHLIHQDSIDALAHSVPQNPILSWVSSGDFVLGQNNSDSSSRRSSNRPDWFKPPNHYRLAEVVEKQHCQVRRETNRYRLALNTRFFRLRVRPVCIEPAMSSAASTPSLNTFNLAQQEDRRQSVDTEQFSAGTSPQ